MSKAVGEWLILLGYCAIIFVLVRPGSQGPALVGALATGTAALVNASTGGGGWNGG
jgi:hypothetical protein